MDEKEFKNYIKNNEALYLIEYCFENLTTKQVQIAFNKVIENNEGHLLLKYCYEKLTEEQINIIKMKNNLT